MFGKICRAVATAAKEGPSGVRLLSSSYERLAKRAPNAERFMNAVKDLKEEVTEKKLIQLKASLIVIDNQRGAVVATLQQAKALLAYRMSKKEEEDVENYFENRFRRQQQQWYGDEVVEEDKEEEEADEEEEEEADQEEEEKEANKEEEEEMDKEEEEEDDVDYGPGNAEAVAEATNEKLTDRQIGLRMFHADWKDWRWNGDMMVLKGGEYSKIYQLINKEAQYKNRTKGMKLHKNWK